MKKENLRIGLKCDVVKVLDYGFTDKSLFKIDGFTIGFDDGILCVACLPNGKNILNEKLFMLMEKDIEVKSIGRLTITKLK